MTFQYIVKWRVFLIQTWVYCFFLPQKWGSKGSMWLSYLTYLRKVLNAHFYKSSSRVCKHNQYYHDRYHQVPALSLALNVQGRGNYYRQEIENTDKKICGKESYLRSKTYSPSLLDSNSKLLELSISKNQEGKDAWLTGPCKATPIHAARKTGWTVDLGRAIGGLAYCHFPVWLMIQVFATHVPHYPQSCRDIDEWLTQKAQRFVSCGVET